MEVEDVGGQEGTLHLTQEVVGTPQGLLVLLDIPRIHDDHTHPFPDLVDQMNLGSLMTLQDQHQVIIHTSQKKLQEIRVTHQEKGRKRSYSYSSSWTQPLPG